MSEKLISADRLIQFVENWGKLHGREEAADSFLYAIRNAPAVDAVEVVRCGKCKHYYQYHVYETNEATGWGKCTLINMDIDMTVGDYCSHGERRKNNEID